MTPSLRSRVVDAGARAMEALPYDIIELRNWGESSVADPAHVLADAALDAMLDVLAEHVVEWRREAWQGDSAAFTGMVGDLIATLRDHRSP